MRKLVLVAAALATVAMDAGPAQACGGLVGANGTVNLVRTTTLAVHRQGVEHYVTSFRFAGVGGAFGSIVPLPGVPSNVERGGDWTLQRLVREVRPPVRVAASADVREAAAAPAEVLSETRIDALDLTVLSGGGRAVGEWATANGFALTPDAPEVLDFYARRSPVFLAARFDGQSARERNLALGEGIPVHLTIPTANPWVPLRILGLGRQRAERVDADVFLLTERRPRLLAASSRPGTSVERQEPASDRLLADLRSDKGMEWMPGAMWLSYLRVAASPSQLTYDLAVDASGAGEPSLEAAGLPVPGGDSPGGGRWGVVGLGGGGLAMLGTAAVVASRRRPRSRAAA